MIAKGGDGGRGNMQFKSSVNQAPRYAEPGWPGQEMWVWLRLKVIADVGLIGQPNAGNRHFYRLLLRLVQKLPIIRLRLCTRIWAWRGLIILKWLLPIFPV